MDVKMDPQKLFSPQPSLSKEVGRKRAEGARKQLYLSTIAFAIAFAVWGSMAGAAPLLKKMLGLSPFQTSFLVALPVALGSLGRIPMGVLTDRFGPRLTMSSTLALSGFCAIAIGFCEPSYSVLLGFVAFLGISGTAFAIGVAHIASWYPKSQQGFALGIFGLGNAGQSLALFGIPFLDFLGSWKIGFIVLGLLSSGWALVYWIQAKESLTRPSRRRSLKEMFLFLKYSSRVRILSLYYFLTFGGFIAMSIYLPILFKDQFLLNPQEAGIRTACFIILATLMRPVGGWISDQVGALKILSAVFLGFFGFTFLLMNQEIGLFSFGILGFATCAGLGNGAVFKLVPFYFPRDTGMVSGLVGASGGLGGFLPPLILGFSFQRYGDYSLGWLGLLIFSLLCFGIVWKAGRREKKAEMSLRRRRFLCSPAGESGNDKEREFSK
jgi:NNP family nitrate/nitrite transporter-like MFS transporter